MSKRVQFRRGTTSQHAAFIGAPGEITVDTDKNIVVVHDGVTPGGFPANRLSDIDGTTSFSGQLAVTSSIPSTSITTGAIVVTGGIGVSQRVVATEFVETSSIAFKENIQPLNNALNFVTKLEGVTYTRRGETEIESGFIAEDVANIIPEVVSKDVEGNPYGIKYTKIIAYLVEAIKEQQVQITELKNRKQ